MFTLITPSFPQAMRYGFAVFAVLIASLLREFFAPVLGAGVPFILYFPTVALAAWFGGFGPGMLSTLLSGLTAWYLFMPPPFSFAVFDPNGAAQLIVFVLSSFFICSLAESLHQATRKAHEGETKEREQREQYRVTLASVGDAVIATDATGRVTFMNAIAESLTGWTYAEASGQLLNQVFNIINERTREPVGNPALEALKKGLVIGLANHSVLVAKNGTERPIDDSAAPIRTADGTIVGAVLVFRDVTERRHGEKTTATLAAIVESSDDAIVSKDLNGIIMTWNAGAERLFGYRPDEVVGQPITVIIPPERIGEEAEILRRIRNGESLEHCETVRVRKDGTQVEVSLTVSPVKAADGTIIGASKIARDITERRRMERELREADRQKDNFIAILAHELRNPLAPIQNTIKVLQLERADDRELLDYCDLIEKETKQINRLLGDLLDISRMTQGKLSLQKERIDITRVVQSAIESCRPALDEAGQKLAIELANEPLPIRADPMRLAQVFSNLLNNAAKFSQPGGEIHVTAERHDHQVVVRVRDSGIGIAPELLPKVFDMFVQGETVTERSHGGLGLGLTLARDIVQLHGGSIEAKSAGLGQGSEFVVSLPLAPVPRPVGTGRSAAIRMSAAMERRRIVIVDDSKNQVLSLERLFKRMGHDVRVAYDAADAIRVMQEFLPDFALIDIGLPGVNGYDLARRLREQTQFRNVILIAQTGWGREEDRNEARAAGFDYHLVKPIDYQQLAEILANPLPAWRS